MPSDPNALPESTPAVGRPVQSTEGERCEVCGSERLAWRNCKLICGNCRSIVKSCADL